MAKVKSLYEDTLERRLDELVIEIMNKASEYGLHPDDDHDVIVELAAERLFEETGYEL